MKIYKLFIYLLALSISPCALAKSDYDAYRLGDYQHAFSRLDARSEQDAVANYYLGRMVLYGYGQLRNEALALRYFEKSAAEGYLPAQLFMGKYNLQIKNNSKKAFKWFKKAADQGDVSAQSYVAAAYLYGFGTMKSASSARRYYIDASQNGDPIAQFTLAEYFLESRYASNHRLGVIWLKKSAESNNPKAQIKLAELYLQGKHVDKNESKAIGLLKKAIAQHAVSALVIMGDLALKKNEPEQAVDWYEKAANLKNISAQLKLAQLYLDDKHSLYDEKKGFLWTLKAALSGSVEGQQQLAELYTKGIGVESNEKLGKQWAQKAEKTAKAKEKEEDSPKVLVAQWLTNNASEKINLPQYQPGGIFSEWTNPETKQEMIYNQAPKMDTLTLRELFKPQFKLVQPNQIPINEYYDALINNQSEKEAKEWRFPIYPLNKHLQAEVRVNSYVLKRHELTLPFTDRYTLPDRVDLQIDWFSKWNQQGKDVANYLSIFNHLYDMAILGNAKAQFYVGQMFQYGLGVMQSDQQAITFYLKAAEQQYLPAQYSMAVIYLQNKAEPELYLRGFKWMEDAAFKGNRYAQYVMANILQARPGERNIVKTDNEQALSMLYLSAANGFGLAQYELAEALVHNKHVDLSEAFQNERRQLIHRLYFNAAEQGVVQAQLPLAFFNAMEKDDALQKEAFEVAQKQAQAGNPNAALLVALLYDRGIGTAVDHYSAMRWYQKSGNNLIRQFIIGTYLSEGGRIAQDKMKGKSLLQQAALKNFSYANLNLAVLAEQNGSYFLPQLINAYQGENSIAGLLLADYSLAKNASPESLERAHFIYAELAEKGNAAAQLKLAYMFVKGIGIKQDAKEAHRWYLASAEQGNAYAQYQLGQFYQLGKEGTPDYEKALAWYEKAAGKLPSAYVATGFIQETVFDNYQKAMVSYKDAAENGQPLGAYNLALMYEYGKGMPVDYKLAKTYYHMAAEKNVPEAMSQLAGLYFHGLGTPRHTQKALKWYKKAADLKDDTALYQLGLLSETGVAGKLDYADALSYYQQAAELGNDKALIALARMYQYGLGIGQNIDKAMELYQQLAKRHNAYAQYQLAAFYLGNKTTKPMPDKGRELLENASSNGYFAAQNVLQSIKAQSQIKTSYIEPARMNQALFDYGQSADLIYFNALAEWNRGDEALSRMMLKRLMAQFPHYLPAKKTYEQLNKSMNSFRFDALTLSSG